MALNILLLFTILLHIVVLFISTRLMRVTKFRSAWVLFFIAYILMLFQLIIELVGNLGNHIQIPMEARVWVMMFNSLFFVAALFVVNKLISHTWFTERKRRISEERLLNAIITTEEKERRRFSKDLHDNLGPLLSSAKLSISALSSLESTRSQKEILNNADSVINEAIKSLKETSNNLSPHILNNFGVVRAINTFVNKLILPSQMRVEFNTNMRNQRYNDDIEAIMYRVVCELLNNSIKYSQATKIDITVWCNDDHVELNVSDNGVGFDYEKLQEDDNAGMGLSNITSRISSLKGEMTIDSDVGVGTIIKILINIK